MLCSLQRPVSFHTRLCNARDNRLCISRCRKQQQTVVTCRYDKRKSFNNAESRRRYEGKKPGQLLHPEEFAEANETVVADRARVLRACTRGQLHLQLCMFMFTEQPQLLSLNTKQLASRILTLADVLGLSPADVGEVVTRCPALLDVLPLRLRAYLQSLCAALNLTTPQALFMLSGDLNLLDTPALRLRQYLEGLAQLLQVPWELWSQLAWQCPYLLRVEAAALQVRWSSLQSVLGINTNALQQLLAKEPRLLMISSKAMAQNHAEILSTLNISATTLDRWVFAAPMLLMVPAAQLQQRLDAVGAVLKDEAQQLLPLLVDCSSTQLLHQPAATAQGRPQLPLVPPPAAATDVNVTSGRELEDAVVPLQATASSNGSSSSSNSSNTDSNGSKSSGSSGPVWVSVADDPLQVMAYVSKDPRVLLLSPQEVRRKLGHISHELGLGLWVVAWLVMSHPSYMAMEAGLATAWMNDVRHLAGLTLLQAKRLVACPQVFLTMSPEDILANLHSLGQTLNPSAHTHSTAYTPDLVAAIAAEEPLLLVQHPAVTITALRQLQGLVPEQPLQQQLVRAAPELLLQGPQLLQAMQRVAAALSISCSQLAVILVRDPGFWSLVVPRHTWPCCPHWHQQQPGQDESSNLTAAAGGEVHLSAAAASAAATLSTLVYCGLRAPEVMQAAVLLHPRLLRLSPAEALQRVEVLQYRCSQCPRWQQQLQDSLSPNQLGKALTRASTWDARLAFFVAVGWSRSIELEQLMQLTRKEFQMNFGVEYCRWQAQQLQWRLQAQGVPLHVQQQQMQGLYRLQQLMGLQGRHQQRLPEEEQRNQVPQQQQALQVPEHHQQPQSINQQRLQQSQVPGELVDGFVEAMQAKLDDGLQRTAAAAAEAGRQPAPPQRQRRQQGQQQHGAAAQQLRAGSVDGDVYYGDALLPSPGDNSSSSFASSVEEDEAWDEVEQLMLQQERLLLQQTGQQGQPGWLPEGVQHVVQQQVQQDEVSSQQDHHPTLQQQQQQQGPELPAPADDRRKKYIANNRLWSVNRREQVTAAAQLSGLELYGTWLGCLVQPAGVAAAAAGPSGSGVASRGSAGVDVQVTAGAV